MSYSTISGLRFRRVVMSGDFVGGSAKSSQICDALICCRCTSVLADSGMAERHVCVTRFWMAGMSFADVEGDSSRPGQDSPISTPDRMRERVRAANHATMTDLWPHGAKLLRARQAIPLSERYELLSVLFAELAKMEREAAARRVNSDQKSRECRW